MSIPVLQLSTITLQTGKALLDAAGNLIMPTLFEERLY